MENPNIRHSLDDVGYSVKRMNKKIERLKKSQHDAQLILSIFRQPLHVSGKFRPIIGRCNRMYTTIGAYFYFQMTVPIRPGQQTVI